MNENEYIIAAHEGQICEVRDLKLTYHVGESYDDPKAPCELW